MAENSTQNIEGGVKAGADGGEKTDVDIGGGARANTDDSGETDMSASSDDDGARGGLTSPEAVIMLPIALFFDVLGIILNILFDLNIISDTFAIIIIGLWTLSRTGDISASFKKSGGKGGGAAEDIMKKIGQKFGLTFLIKIIPFVGSLFSFWTYRVYKELKNG